MVEKKETFSLRECDLKHQNLEDKLKGLSTHVDKVECNLLEAVKQSVKVAELASNGHKDSLHTTLRSIHQNFERGTERFRALETRVGKLNQDLIVALGEVQRLKFDIHFVLEDKETFKEWLSFPERYDSDQEILVSKLSWMDKKIKYIIYAVGIALLFFITYEISGHSLQAVWNLLIGLLT